MNKFYVIGLLTFFSYAQIFASDEKNKKGLINMGDNSWGKTCRYLEVNFEQLKNKGYSLVHHDVIHGVFEDLISRETKKVYVQSFVYGPRVDYMFENKKLNHRFSVTVKQNYCGFAAGNITVTSAAKLNYKAQNGSYGSSRQGIVNLISVDLNKNENWENQQRVYSQRQNFMNN
ncbi:MULTISPECIES: hypothetical protein [Cysteiniphilum]|uniref:hypothetical protein n=1 Tax=Cysteiniphilum TaxID=2056696 RepID=UPI0017866507|nr:MULTISPECIES: hypothetical protein [Cysteiniphilum]